MHWYFVATSSPTVGHGHVSRLKLLAKATAAAFPSHRQAMILVTPDNDSSPLSHLQELNHLQGAAIVVIDGPDPFVNSVIAQVGARSPSVLVAAFRMYGVPVGRTRHEDVSLVPSFAPTRLEHRSDGFVYTGRRLVLVRSSLFADETDAKRDPPHVLVTMGSADPSDLTTLAAEALVGLETRYRITLVVGALNPRAPELRERYSDRFEVIHQEEADFDSLLKSAGIAIVSGGLTRYECIAAKTPFVSISLNEQQAKYTSAVTEAGFGVHAGVLGTVSADQVREAFLRLATDPAALNRMRLAAVGMLRMDNPYELANFLEAASQGTWSAR